jgi:hypothetical protein
MRLTTHGNTTNDVQGVRRYPRSLAPVLLTGASSVSPPFRDVLFILYKFRASDDNKQVLLTLSVYS